MWAVDPPTYFTEGLYVAVVGNTYEDAYKQQVYTRFPDWSPQRHMFMDAPQRQAVRDVLGLAAAVGGIAVLPKLWCHCDRYWNALSRCRMPELQSMSLPFNCPMDSLYDPTRWANKKVKFREHTFLQNPNVPDEMRANTVNVTVAREGVKPRPSTVNTLEVPYGTRMSDVKAAVVAINPRVRVIQMANDDVRRLCRWLGDSRRQDEFNKVGVRVVGSRLGLGLGLGF